MSAVVILLSPSDNVVVCCRAVVAGEVIAMEDREIIAASDVPLGHKLALTALRKGEKVLKHGMPVGSMTADAAPGDWIHIHNMKSDYMPAHLRDAQGDRA